MQIYVDAFKDNPTGPTKLIEDLIDWIRPKKNETSQDAIKRFMDFHREMQRDAKFAFAFGSVIRKNFAELNYIRLFTESGIPSNEGFLVQARTLIFNRILPEVRDRNDVVFWLQKIFWHPKDYIWVKDVPNELWAEVFQLAGLKEIYQLPIGNHFLRHVLNSIQVVSLRINALGTVPDIVEKLPQLERFDSPFMEQYREVANYLAKYMEEDFDRSTANNDFRHINVLLDQCRTYVETFRRRKKVFGVSFRLTNYIVRLRKNLKRLQFLLYLITVHKDDFPFKEEVHLLEDLVKAEGDTKSLRKHAQEHLSLVSYQITENTGITGEKYITSTPKDYMRMFVSSCQGGLIVGFMSLIKLFFSFLSLPLFGTAFMYSMNYSLGFMLIHITHGKLATKQPAMTASRLASALDPKEDEVSSDLNEIAKMIKQMFRTQFIAFVGNVIISFPTAVLISVIYFWVTGTHTMDESKAWYLIDELHPVLSLALPHAAIAGICLFLSGLMTGYYDNLCVTTKLPVRLRNWRFLRRFLGPKSLVSFSNYIDKNFGQLAGNFYLGVFLGTMGVIGIILGLPLDIRHITFSAANFGLALVALDFTIPLNTWIYSVLGVLGIGIMNFLFSFTPSLLVALKSRSVSFREESSLFLLVIKLFFKTPLSFFFPVDKETFEDTEKNE